MTAHGLEPERGGGRLSMNSELPVSADALLAERARLEEVLQSSEDWCELLRLKSRKDRGEGMSAVNAARLEMVLIDALAEDPNFVRYKAVCVALERLIRGLPPLPPKGEKPPVEKDDLTEIEGITASMQRRLNALDVTTFMHIAEWTPADVKSISADLGIGRQIYEQDWIGQAEELATRSDVPPPKPAHIQKQPPPERPTAGPRAVEMREPPAERSPPPTVREAPRPTAIPVAKVEAKPTEVTPPPSLKQVEVARGAPPSAKDAPVVQPPVQKPAVVEARPQEQPAKPPVQSDRRSDAAHSPSAPSKLNDGAKPASNVASPPVVRDAPTVPVQPADVKPLADPPRPLKAEIYKPPPGSAPTAESVSTFKPVAASQREQEASQSSASVAQNAKPLAAPPRPLVITRASLPPRPKIEIASATPASQRPPEPPPKPVATVANLTAPPKPPASTAQPAPPTTSSAPTMSIAEAIAYAAELARKSPKAATPNIAQSREPAAPINGAAAGTSAPSQQPPKSEPVRQPAPAPQPVQQPKSSPATARVAAPAPAVAAKPAIPPPLPADFVPPAEETEIRAGVTDRDDRTGQRTAAEEATVEIVVKSAPELLSTPRATLTKVAAETTANTQRPATPIGRFLKALTGN